MANSDFQEFAGVTLALFSQHKVFDIALTDAAECAGMAKEFEKRGCVVQRFPGGNRLSVMRSCLAAN